MEPKAVRLAAVPPYDFHLTAGLFARYSTQVADYYVDGTYRRVLTIDELSFLVEAKSIGNVRMPAVELRSLAPPSFKLDMWARDQMKWILALDYDLSPLYSLMAAQPETRALKEALFGFRPPRCPSMFEALVNAITEQQISLAAALTIRERMARRFGAIVSFNGREYLAFPRPEALACAEGEEIVSLGLGGHKARAIRIVADLVTDGRLDLDSYRTLPVEQAIDDLTRIKGIGPWTVQYMLCRGAGRYDSVPLNDKALMAGMRKWFGAERVKSVSDIGDILATFGRFAGYLAFYAIISYALDRRPSHRQL